MDSFNKFDKTELPTKEEFYSILNDEHITDDQYTNMLKTFGKNSSQKNMSNYHDLYLISDILLLTDAFVNFRETCLEYYKLDPSRYFTSLGLSWDAMLKISDIRLEFRTDIEICFNLLRRV